MNIINAEGVKIARLIPKSGSALNLPISSKFNSNDEKRLSLQLEKTRIEEGAIRIISSIIASYWQKTSLAFLNTLITQCIAKKSTGFDFKLLYLWVAIEIYSKHIKKNEQKLAKEYLNLIEQYLQNIRNKTRDLAGVYLLPTYLDKKLLVNIYMLNDNNLSTIFSKYLTVPSVNYFTQFVPIFVYNYHKKSGTALTSFFAKNLNKEKFVETVILKLQRNFRRKQRIKQEIVRIPFAYPKSIEAKNSSKAIVDANSLYQPKLCDNALAQRLVHTALNITLFKNIQHFCSYNHINSLFEGIYGRKNLLELGIAFREAALAFCDVKDGDSNSICFAPQDIDPMCIQNNTVGLVFNFNKITQNNPTVFFKQCDLGYELSRIRRVKIKDNYINFCHTLVPPNDQSEVVCLYIYDNHKNIIATAKICKAKLISYNVKNIHTILILNFFRMLDNLYDLNNETQNQAALIYKQIAQLNEQELVDFLKDLGKNFSDTSEVNIYGAHNIDFTSLDSLVYYKGKKEINYHLDMAEFVSSLQMGETEKLNQAIKNVPNIFKSYRFIDYLLSVTTSPTVRKVLTDLRFETNRPSWAVTYNPFFSNTKASFLSNDKLKENKTNQCNQRLR